MKSTTANESFRYDPRTQATLLEILKRHESNAGSLQSNGSPMPTLPPDPVWEYRVPTVDEFLFDEYYLGRTHAPKAHPNIGLYDFWGDQLRFVLDPTNGIVEVLVQSAIGVGKTTTALTALLFWLCQSLCLRNPQVYSGLEESSPMVFFIYSVTLNRGQNVCRKTLVNIVKRSAFFMEHLISARGRGEIVFNKNIVIEFGSQSRHALGAAVKFAMLDESNQGVGSSHEGEGIANQMLENYRTTYQRLVSRYTKPGGGVDGQIWMVSSPRAKNDVLNRHIVEARMKKIPTTRVIEAPLYIVKSHVRGRPSKLAYSKTFDVVVGDRFLESRILAPGEQTPPGYQIHSVPVDYRDSFDKDITTSLRDICAVSSDPTCKLIQNSLRITQCVAPQRRSPFSVETIHLRFDSSDQVSDWFDIQYFTKSIQNSLNADFSVHVDPATKHDYLGLCMCHIGSADEVALMNPISTTGDSGRTVYVNDFTIRIKNVPGQVLPLRKICDFILWLRDGINLNISVVSCDQFGFEAITQPLMAHGMNTRKLSVDRDDDAYTLLRELIYTGRLVLYDYKPLLDELADLNHFPARCRVDHPEGGSKDLTDALAGAVYNLSKKEAMQGKELGPPLVVVSASDLARMLRQAEQKDWMKEFG